MSFPRACVPLAFIGLLVLAGCGAPDDGDGGGGSEERPETPGASAPWNPDESSDDGLSWIAGQRDLPTPGPADPESQDPGEAVSLIVGDGETGTSYEATGAGISFEATDLADERLSAENSDLVRILGGLDRPTLRFGGNTVDRRFFFTDRDEKVPQDWPLRPGERITTVAPEDLERLAGLAEATDAQVIISVNLAAEDPDRAATMARYADEYLGDRLAGIMVGNEPNGYYLGESNPLTIKGPDWDTQAYQADLAEYVAAIRAEAPEVTIAGPGAFAPAWWRAVTESEITGTALAVHQYPLSECSDPAEPGYLPEQTPTIANLAAPETRGRVDHLVGTAIDTVAGTDTPVWITETSVSSCQGSNELTETLAAGVFSADYLLRTQHLGVERVDFHSSLLPCFGGPPMSLLCSSGSLQDPGEAFVPRTNGLALSLAGSLPSGQFLDTTLRSEDGSVTGGAEGENVTAWAIRHEDGTSSIVVIDFRTPEDADPLDLSIELPGPISSASTSMLSGDDWSGNYPETTLFDGAPESGNRITHDSDGVALDNRSATAAVGEGLPSVDGYGLPLLPPELQPQVTGVQPGDTTVSLRTAPGAVTVVSTSPQQ